MRGYHFITVGSRTPTINNLKFTRSTPKKSSKMPTKLNEDDIMAFLHSRSDPTGEYYKPDCEYIKKKHRWSFLNSKSDDGLTKAAAEQAMSKHRS